MPTEIIIPEVGESVTSGVVAAWTKQSGEYVERDEVVMELETDKITMEIPAPAAGVLTHGAAEGDEVEVGSSVGSIDESAEKPEKAAATTETKSETSQEESSSAPKESVPSKAPAEPTPAAPASKASPSEDPAPTDKAPAAEVHATPVARKLAEEHGIRLDTLHGTGAGSRIREQDVLAAIQRGPSNGSAVANTSSPASGSRSTSLERMSPMRRSIAARLVEAQQTAAMLTTFNEVDMTAVMALRKAHKDEFTEKHGVGLGFMSFFVKAVVGGLQKFPMVNAFITDNNGSPAIQHHDYQDVAIAVSSPKGLVVPVLRNAEGMSFAGIESAIKDYAIKAKEGKLTLDEMAGGTFTITNGGIFGSLMSTPILNPPQSAILGMHGIKKRAVEHPDKPGEIALRPMMYLALSYDHRIIDGATAVQFLVHIKDAIEDPQRLMLDI